MENRREFHKNIYFCFIEYTKALDCVDHKQLWKILKEMGLPDHHTCLLRKQGATVRTGFKLGKEDKAIYCYPAYFNYMQSTSGEMPHWMQHKLESRLLGELSITSDMQMIPL